MSPGHPRPGVLSPVASPLSPFAWLLQRGWKHTALRASRLGLLGARLQPSCTEKSSWRERWPRGGEPAAEPTPVMKGPVALAQKRCRGSQDRLLSHTASACQGGGPPATTWHIRSRRQLPKASLWLQTPELPFSEPGTILDPCQCQQSGCAAGWQRQPTGRQSSLSVSTARAQDVSLRSTARSLPA